ncbi:MAG: PilZ domain-containing protein [Terriglobales bacterium]
MGPSGKTQHAIRRSTRLPLEVPVLVTSLDPARPFSEQCNTTLVNAHGCGLIVPHALTTGLAVRLEIVSAKRHTTARVSEVVPLGGDPETWLVGLELDVPGNFWGIDYAPSDWKVDEQRINHSPSSAAEHQQLDQPNAAPKPARSHRWRLTDISAGACYLEASAPFPAGTPVLLSIRVSDTECLLEGAVRVSHPLAGMGVEFTRAEGHDLRTRVAELIAQLMNSHEVPRIFVGRKEGKQALAKQAPAAARDESPDPLLDLIHTGASLTVEEFLKALRAQRLPVD